MSLVTLIAGRGNVWEDKSLDLKSNIRSERHQR